jgi:DNA-binding transcriptional LysR family regulator
VVLPDAFRPAPRELSIQYPHRDRVAPRVRAVVDHLLAAWAKHPDLHATAADLKRHAA